MESLLTHGKLKQQERLCEIELLKGMQHSTQQAMVTVFNSVSIQLFGDESKAVERRVRTALEMIHRSRMYSEMSDLLTMCPSYLDATVDCAKKKVGLVLGLCRHWQQSFISYLCTKHLHENIIKYLTDKVSVSKTDCSIFLAVLFGSDSLTNSDSSFCF